MRGGWLLVVRAVGGGADLKVAVEHEGRRWAQPAGRRQGSVAGMISLTIVCKCARYIHMLGQDAGGARCGGGARAAALRVCVHAHLQY